MAALISFPFRVAPDGSVVTREDGDPDYYAEELAVLISTRPGERPLVPDYGLSDPVFAEFDAAELGAQVDVFGPPVTITDVAATFVSATHQDVIVSFDAGAHGAVGDQAENIDDDSDEGFGFDDGNDGAGGGMLSGGGDDAFA